MGCTPLRVDHLDFNHSGNPHEIAAMLPKAGENKAYIIYSALQNETSTQRGGIFLREYDIDAFTLSSVRNVNTDNSGSGRVGVVIKDNRWPKACILSDGRIICGYAGNSAYGAFMKESTDGGITWTSEVQLILPGSLASNTSQHLIKTIATDGTDVFAMSISSAGTSNLDWFLWKRTGVGTWNVCKVFNSTSSNINTSQCENADHMLAFKKVATGPDTWKMAFVTYYSDSTPAPDTSQIVCIQRQDHIDAPNTDVSASWTRVLIHDFTGDGIRDHEPLMLKGSDETLRCSYIRPSTKKVYSADSSDFGQTWTDRGLLTAPNSKTWEDSHTRASALASNSWWFISTIDGGNDWYIYRNEGLTDGGWSLDASCNIDSPFALETNSGVGEMLIYPDDTASRLTSDSDALSGSFFRIWLTQITVTTPPGPEGPPCNVAGNLTVCPDGPNPSTQLCGPVGLNYTYFWTLPDGSHSTQRCIAADQLGTYTLVVTDPGTGLSTSCEGILALGDDCPEILSSNRIFRRGVIKAQRASSPQPNYEIRPMEKNDRPLWGGS